ncbi:MAG: hypothetical protein IJ623_09275 [Bacteroidales bacterium]|nr:hypothetical protein [Bacteroidales bacterium]
MKKTFFLLLAISSLAFISCGKIQEQDNHEPNSTEDAGCFEIVGIIHNTESSAPEVKTQYNIGPEYATFSWTQNDEIQLIVYKTTQTQDQYRLYAESSSATTTFKSGSTTYDPIGGIVDGWLSTGFAIYPVSKANNGIQRDDYISYIKPSASPYDPVTISMRDSYTLSNLDNQLSVVPMVGIQNANNELVYDFYPAVGVLAFSISAVPVTATAVRLTSFDSTEPLCGTFSMTKGVPDIAMAKVQSGSLTRTVTLPSRTASQDITVYIPLPVGSIAHGLRIELLDGSATPIFKKKYSDVLEIERGVIKTVNLETPEWKKLGKGKFIDNYMWNKLNFGSTTFSEVGYVNVDIYQNTSDHTQYRIPNPYGQAAAYLNNAGISQSSHDDYLYFTVSDSEVSFNEHKTGYTVDGHNLSIQPVSSSVKTKLVHGTVDSPGIVQLAPSYYDADDNSYDINDKSNSDNIIRINFPTIDSSYEGSLSIVNNKVDLSSGIAYTKGSAADRVIIQISDYPIFHYYGTGASVPGSRVTKYDSNTLQSSSLGYGASGSNYDQTHSGIKYLTWSTWSANAEYMYEMGCIKFYGLVPDDSAALPGTYYIGNSSDYQLVFAESSDPTRGNIVISAYPTWSLSGTLYGVYDASAKTMTFDGSQVFNQHSNGTYYCVHGQGRDGTIRDVIFSVANSSGKYKLTPTGEFGIGEATVADGIATKYTATSHVWNSTVLYQQ